MDDKTVADQLDYLYRKAVESESNWASFLGLQRDKEEATARIAAARDKEMLNSIAKLVRDAVREESAAQSALLEERFGRLAAEVKGMVEPFRACLDEEERRRELLEAVVAQKPDREEFETLTKVTDRRLHEQELMLDGGIAAVRKDIFDENGVEPRMEKELGDQGKRLRAIEDAPGKKARKVLELVGAAAVPVAGYGVFEWIKSLISKGGST